LNLFDDLGIGTEGGPFLNMQTFIFRLEGQNGRAVTETYTISGDQKRPDLTIDAIKHERPSDGANSLKGEYAIVGGKLYKGGVTEVRRLETLVAQDRITITGTWGDDSYDAWQDKDRFGPFTVKWNRKLIAQTERPDNPRTWTATYIVDADDATSGGGEIEARLYDLGNNRGEAVFTVDVDTTTPMLLNASSSHADGFYNGGVFEIYLRFNKDMKFEPANPAAPVYPRLKLNLNQPGGTVRYATYDTASSAGDGSQYQRFTYTVVAGDNTPTEANGRRVPLDIAEVEMFDGRWYGGGIAASVVPDGMNLKDSKNIYIDTVAPKIIGVRSLSGAGGNARNDFGAGQTLLLVVTFDEEIQYRFGEPGYTGGKAELFLNVNDGTDAVHAEVARYSGITSTLMFEYTVAAGHNTPTSGVFPNEIPNENEPLQVPASGFAFGTSITDQAGNVLVPSFTAGNINTGTNARKIYIDTIKPPAPTLDLGSFTSGPPPVTIKVTGGQEGALVEYRTSESESSWMEYVGKVAGEEFWSEGSHILRARQTDLAGNTSDASLPQTINIAQVRPLLQSFGGTTTGTYKTGDVIQIVLNLREEVTLQSGTMTLNLNIGSGKSVNLNAGAAGTTNTRALTFRYTVAAGDSIAGNGDLQISSISGTFVLRTIASPHDVEGELPLDGKTGNGGTAHGLDYYTKIKIDTVLPTLSSVALSGTTLTLTFNKEIAKGSGDLTVRINNDNISPFAYLLPAVLTKSQYERWGYTALDAWYDIGTNGVLANGSADTSEKHILKYDINPSDTGGLAAAARTALVNNGASRVVVPVASGAVSVNTASRNQLTVNLSDTYGYVLPVKGVVYNVTYGEGLVQDNLGNKVAALSTTQQVTPTGVNPPFIRVKKDRATYNTDTQAGFIPVQTAAATVTVANANDAPFRSAWLTFSNNDNTREAFAYWVNISGTVTGTPPVGTNVNGDVILYGVEWHPHNNDDSEWNRFFKVQWARLVGLSYTGTGNLDGFTVKESLGSGTWILQNTTRTTVAAKQPYTAQFKIDCQTNDAAITYTSTQVTTPVYSGRTNGGNNYTFMYPVAGYPNPSVAIPAAAATSYTRNSNITLGIENDTQGLLYGIRATAANGGQTESAGERAARSVIRFRDVTGANNWSTLSNIANANNRSLELWIRGGDGADGGANLTPGFPMSWDEKDLGGARLFTRDTNGHYWITWEITASEAYFHFMAGSVDRVQGTNTAPVVEQRLQSGPMDWGWAKNAWAFQYSEYPLFPGASLEFRVGSTVSKPATTDFEFYNSFSGSR
jgi:hypothetical protein